MPNTNFQTFHQMGQAINEVVRQATGRDNVQNIDMEHITVAQNHYYQDVDLSGRVVSFHAGASGLPLEKCVVQIEPVQDLHGYDHPWPAGGGKNLLGFKIPNGSITTGGVTITQNNDGSITINGTSNARFAWNQARGVETFAPQKLIAGTKYILSGSANRPQGQTYVQLIYKDDVTEEVVSIVSQNATPESVTPTNNCTLANVYCTITNGVTFLNDKIYPQFEIGTSASSYTPYSNICPITGWTGANVYVSPTTDAEDGQTYTIAFPSEAGTVYGGTLDAVSGVLVVDRMNIASYNGETLPGKWISDRDVYVEGATPMTGAQVVYELAEPITYHLTPTEITTLLGVNNIWSDAGDIEVKFTDIKEFY